MLISLNADDPALLGTDLISEYRTCAQAFAETRTLCAPLHARRWRASFASPALKSELLRNLQEFARAMTPDESRTRPSPDPVVAGAVGAKVWELGGRGRRPKGYGNPAGSQGDGPL